MKKNVSSSVWCPSWTSNTNLHEWVWSAGATSQLEYLLKRVGSAAHFTHPSQVCLQTNCFCTVITVHRNDFLHRAPHPPPTHICIYEPRVTSSTVVGNYTVARAEIKQQHIALLSCLHPPPVCSSSSKKVFLFSGEDWGPGSEGNPAPARTLQTFLFCFSCMDAKERK